MAPIPHRGHHWLLHRQHVQRHHAQEEGLLRRGHPRRQRDGADSEDTRPHHGGGGPRGQGEADHVQPPQGGEQHRHPPHQEPIQGYYRLEDKRVMEAGFIKYLL